MRRLLALATSVFVFGCATGSTGDMCKIPGHARQWQADYCLASVGTDDLIAAQPCLDHEAAVRFSSTCAQKQHYKRALCKLIIENGSKPGSIDDCFNDPNFMGKVVRNDGI